MLNKIFHIGFMQLVLFVTIIPLLAFSTDPISEGMCRDERSFQSCYGFTKDECLRYADKAVVSCSVRKLPPRPAPPKTLEELANSNFGRWNVLLGYCAEERFEKSHQDRFQNTPDCNELLNARTAHRSQNKPELAKYFSWKEPQETSGIQDLFTVVIPFIYGLAGSILYLRNRRKKKKIAFFEGLISWILFLFSAFIGELSAWILFPWIEHSVNRDAPGLFGFSCAILLSLFFNPIIWLYFRAKSKTPDLHKSV